MAPKKRGKPVHRNEQTSSVSNVLTDEDIGIDSGNSNIDPDENRSTSESLPPPLFEFDVDLPAVPENTANIDDPTDTGSSVQSLSKDEPNMRDHSSEREIFYFFGASGRIISSGTSIHMSMKGKRKH